MLKVLIIDDEPIVRAGLKKIIPWTENGFKVCGEAENFDDGIAKINDLKPDIILTDIKMPGHLGTELIQNVVENGFKGKFIIVSGYSDFEYAKAAIKYGVKSYILKPIDEDELLDVLLSIKSEIESEKSIKQLELGKYILTQEGNLDSRYFNYDTFKIALFHCNSNDESGEKDNLLDKIIKKRLASDDDIDILRIEGIIAVLFKGFNTNRMMNTIKSLHSELSKEMNEDIFITIGETVNHYSELIKAYKSAKSLTKYEFLYLDKGILSNEILNENILLDFQDNKLT